MRERASFRPVDDKKSYAERENTVIIA